MALGSQWMEASGFIGLWGLTSAITIVFSHFACEVYRALGRPKLSVLAHWLHIIVLWPAVLIAVRYGFETLYTVRSWIRMEGVFVDFVIIYFLVHITPIQMLKNVFPSVVALLVAIGVALAVKQISDKSVLVQMISLGACFFVYIAVLILLPQERNAIRTCIIGSDKRELCLSLFNRT